jgi:hypothetical protein
MGLTAGYGNARAALEIAQNDPSWCAHVFYLLRKEVRKQDETLVPGVYAMYLANHQYRIREVMTLLKKLPHRPWDVVICLCLSGDPEQLEYILPEVVRSPIPDHQVTAAAVLGLLDNTWARRELVEALDDYPCWPGDPMFCYAALEESAQGLLSTERSPKHEWEFRADDPKAVDKYKSYKRMLRRRMEELAEAVFRARKRLPSDG